MFDIKSESVIFKWLYENTESLKGKNICITGSTGGIGKHLCRYLCFLGASLILLDRNILRSQENKNKLIAEFPDAKIDCITADLEDIDSVKMAAEELKLKDIDVFIHNAGAYSIPRHICKTGYDNIFQINFISPYYIIKELLPMLRQRNGRVLAVGSIAHNYSKTDETDIDFSTVKAASKVYGNAKRYLMFSLFGLFENEEKVSLSVVHPGITFTNITAHYPKPIFWIIKNPMKIIFMKPQKACLSIIKGLFLKTETNYWIGPRFFGIWGMPQKNFLKTCDENEQQTIFKTAEKIYSEIKG